MGELEKRRGEITWRREISRVLSSLSPSISILVAIGDSRGSEGKAGKVETR